MRLRENGVAQRGERFAENVVSLFEGKFQNMETRMVDDSKLMPLAPPTTS